MESWLWMTLAVLFSAVIAVLQYRGSLQRKDIKWPPGPRKLPVIGNLHQVNKGGVLIHVTLAKLAHQNGGLMTIWFGSDRPMIVVSDLELVWEVLVTKAADFSSRTRPFLFGIMTSDGQTVSSSHFGSYWYNLRTGLQSTALSPDNIFQQSLFQEENVSSMLGSLCNEASSNNGIVKPLLHLRRITVRLISRLCFGSEFEDDIFVDGIDNIISDYLLLSGYSGPAHSFKFLQYIPGFNRPFKEMHQVRHKLERLFRPYISSHKSSCYLQFLLSQNLTEQIIISNLFEMFLFSVDAVSSTVSWALALLIHNPQVQQKLYEEVGSEPVKLENVKNFRYLNAVVKETMRMKPIAPLAVPHRTSRDSMVAGTKIAAGTNVMVNLYKLLHDPNVWVEPDRFMPERFLDSSVVSNKMERSFLPFGVGRRVCAGMELGKLQVAFVLASLVHKFKWSSVHEDQLPDLSEEVTFVLGMKTPLAAHVTPRSVFMLK